MIRRLARNPLTWVLVGVLAAAGVFGLYWFQPWKLFTSKTVNETLPAVDAPATAPPTTSVSDPTPNPAATAAAVNRLLASGDLITHEHETSGTVKLIQLADGRIQLIFENLSTSDGPDLRVWLSDQPVVEGRDGWHLFDDGKYVELGPLKANKGNQVYEVPAGTDIDALTSVSIWCKRFSVSFGAAALQAA
jgi:Electron transfer DM13